MKREVVISGIGIVSAIGANTEDFWRSCLAGNTAVSEIPAEWRDYADLQCPIWSPPPSVDFRSYGLTRLEELQHDKTTLQAICAAMQALEQAGVRHELADAKMNSRVLKDLDPNRCGVFMGSGVGGSSTLIEATGNLVLSPRIQELDKLVSDFDVKEDSRTLSALTQLRSHMSCVRRFNPFIVSMVMPNSNAAALSVKFGLHGPARSFAAACASGTVAIGHAMQAIQNSELDLVIAGASEYLQDMYGGIFRGFDEVGVLVRDCSEPDTVNCPFDERHSGFLFSGGGAAVLVLEEYEHAIRRGAKPIASVEAFAEATDGFNMMLMEERGESIKYMLQSLLQSGNVQAEEVDYINTHGTATPTNDAVEAHVIEEIFGKRPLINATKSLIGHTLGASGAIEAAVTALSLRDQTTHICRNLKSPIRDLNFVMDVNRVEMKTAINQSFGFGGHNAALLLQSV